LSGLFLFLLLLNCQGSASFVALFFCNGTLLYAFSLFCQEISKFCYNQFFSIFSRLLSYFQAGMYFTPIPSSVNTFPKNQFFRAEFHIRQIIAAIILQRFKTQEKKSFPKIFK
jgi:hypothetical protein